MYEVVWREERCRSATLPTVLSSMGTQKHMADDLRLLSAADLASVPPQGPVPPVSLSTRNLEDCLYEFSVAKCKRDFGFIHRLALVPNEIKSKGTDYKASLLFFLSALVWAGRVFGFSGFVFKFSAMPLSSM